jgi:hypothetical protein
MGAMKPTTSRVVSILAPAAMVLLGAAWMRPRAQDAKPGHQLAELAWIRGAWRSELGRAQFEEHWIEPKGGTMLGLGRAVAGEKTLFFEFLRIEQRGEKLVYVAQPNGAPPVDFELTKLEGRSAVFENPGHDHPKVIRYSQAKEGELDAEVEGDENGKHVVEKFHFTAQR